MKSELVIYGTIQMIRVYCYSCRRKCLVVDGIKQCCDQLSNAPPPQIVKRESEPEAKRRTPSKAKKDEILAAQNYCCLYCDIRLDGSYVHMKGEIVKVRLNWDHMTPYCYSLNNGNYIL